ncbi:Os10g0357900 [Oryza sativa Japonica Group]|uniref:Os10g0357900 protein n=1 Tax=Oryza sativa subsp. japonica TaxID=39947 RepID=A0A0P0XT54_ORYSJ|nr:Os10g0357900 [Oryza sativa Japonica Group]
MNKQDDDMSSACRTVTSTTVPCTTTSTSPPIHDIAVTTRSRASRHSPNHSAGYNGPPTSNPWVLTSTMARSTPKHVNTIH